MSENNPLTSLLSLDNRVAVITGASKGIGRATARLFAQAGARVVLAAQGKEALELAEQETRLAGAETLSVSTDVAQPEAVQDLFRQTEERFGAVDILVNNAAVFPYEAFENLTVEQFERILAVNIRGAVLCAQQAVKQMRRKSGGRIINISSTSGLRPGTRDSTSYGISKAGMILLTKQLALEYAQHGILVNAVAPGGVATDGAMARMATDTTVPTGPIVGEGRILLNRPAAPEEIAAAILFFAGEASRYITGQVLAVDGGFLIS